MALLLSNTVLPVNDMIRWFREMTVSPPPNLPELLLIFVLSLNVMTLPSDMHRALTRLPVAIISSKVTIFILSAKTAPPQSLAVLSVKLADITISSALT